MFCPKCGTQAPDGTRFCPKCGNALGGATTRPAGSPVALAAPRFASKDLVIGLAAVVIAIVVAVAFGLVACKGDRGYAGAWEGTAESAGVRVDCTLELDEDGSGELRLSDGSRSEVLGPLEWREVEDGVEISNEGMGNWTLLERRGDTLVNERGTGGIAVEVTRQ